MRIRLGPAKFNPKPNGCQLRFVGITIDVTDQFEIPVLRLYRKLLLGHRKPFQSINAYNPVIEF